MISMGESAMKFKVKCTSWWSVTYGRAMRLDILAIRDVFTLDNPLDNPVEDVDEDEEDNLFDDY
jgi:hypothetical protein